MRPGRPRSRLPVVDLVAEALAGLLTRPSRMVLATAGTTLGLAALVAIAGLTASAGHHIVSRLDALAATEVVVTPLEDQAGVEPAANVLPWDAEARLSGLNGVRAAGTMTAVEVGQARVRTVPVLDPQGQTEFSVEVVAASPGLFAAVQGRVGAGRWFDPGHDRRADRVAVLGPAAADRLGLAAVDAQPAVFVGEVGFTVIGILEAVARQPALLDAVIIPNGAARASFAVPAPDAVHIHTALGAARTIGGQAPLALAPAAVDQLAVRVPPEPGQVRANVASDLRGLVLLLGVLSLVIGGLGIANTMLVGLLERTSEIGLRRSLGAYRSHIAAQFLLESATIGVLGGVLGASTGVLVNVGVATLRGWSAIMEPWVPLAAIVAGAVIGVAAGTYPAWRAASIEPIAALRTEQ